MQIETAILAPAAVLAGWTMIVFLWLIARRMPAFAAAGITVGSMPAGARGVDTEAQLSTKANWISHNYTHLMEQPTVFYAMVIILAMAGDTSTASCYAAWTFAIARILHSLWQMQVNTIPVRFALFAISHIALLMLAVHAVMFTVQL